MVVSSSSVCSAAIVSVMVIAPLVFVEVISVVLPSACAVRLMPGSIPSSITNVRAMLKILLVLI